ncbi:histidinol-phosphate transaminase [Sulfobacillus thermosulfidooxidans]|uniref:histidinol-phosphate transaminase n=1 Tax=Sulfobacillus thermosulfidooxidans TaxID=28034 RepID=UPI0006B4A8DB|nr:histidinol-phosphate transaminase [Sulfobacillus thermosulfidooxidans]
MAIKWSTITEVPLDRGSLSLSNKMIRLNANESPYPPPETVLQAISASMHEIHRYPDPSGRELKNRLAEKYQIDPGQIVLGSGSGDLIEHIIRGLFHPQREVIIPHPSFPLYNAIAQSIAFTTVRTSLNPNGTVNLTNIVDNLSEQTSLIVICNPNNPTGGYLPTCDIDAFLSSVPEDVAVLLDEAYWELTEAYDNPDQDSAHLLKKYPNLIISRTFSKFYALAGIRLGYVLTADASVSHAISQRLSRVMPNRLALAAGVAALSEEAEAVYKIYRSMIQRERTRILARLSQLGLNVFPSQTNFVTFQWEDSEKTLPLHNIAIRPGPSMGLAGYTRMTIGQPDDNERVLNIIEESLNHASTIKHS